MNLDSHSQIDKTQQALDTLDGTEDQQISIDASMADEMTSLYIDRVENAQRRLLTLSQDTGDIVIQGSTSITNSIASYLRGVDGRNYEQLASEFADFLDDKFAMIESLERQLDVPDEFMKIGSILGADAYPTSVMADYYHVYLAQPEGERLSIDDLMREFRSVDNALLRYANLTEQDEHPQRLAILAETFGHLVMGNRDFVPHFIEQIGAQMDFEKSQHASQQNEGLMTEISHLSRKLAKLDAAIAQKQAELDDLQDLKTYGRAGPEIVKLKVEIRALEAGPSSPKRDTEIARKRQRINVLTGKIQVTGSGGRGSLLGDLQDWSYSLGQGFDERYEANFDQLSDLKLLRMQTASELESKSRKIEDNLAIIQAADFGMGNLSGVPQPRLDKMLLEMQLKLGKRMPSSLDDEAGEAYERVMNDPDLTEFDRAYYGQTGEALSIAVEHYNTFAADGEVPDEAQTNIMKAIESDSSITGLREESNKVLEKFGPLQKLLQTVMKGEISHDVFYKMKEYAKDLRGSYDKGSLSVLLADARSSIDSLNQLELGHSNSDLDIYLEGVTDSLNQVDDMLSSGAVDDLCDFILGPEFMADDFRKWWKTHGVTLCVAIGTGLLVCAGIGLLIAPAALAATAGVSQVTAAVLINSFGMATGCLIGTEAGKELSNAFYDTGMKADIHRFHDGEINFMQLAESYTKQFAMNFLMSSAFMMAAATVPAVAASDTLLLSNMARSAMWLGSKIKIPQAFNALSSGYGKYVVQFLSEVVEESAEDFLNGVIPGLGSIAVLISSLDGQNMHFDGSYGVTFTGQQFEGTTASQSYEYNAGLRSSLFENLQEQYGEQGAVTVNEEGVITVEIEHTTKKGTTRKSISTYSPTIESAAMRRTLRGADQNRDVSEAALTKRYGIKYNSDARSYTYDRLSVGGVEGTFREGLLLHLQRDGYIVMRVDGDGAFFVRKGEDVIRFEPNGDLSASDLRALKQAAKGVKAPEAPTIEARLSGMNNHQLELSLSNGDVTYEQVIETVSDPEVAVRVFESLMASKADRIKSAYLEMHPDADISGVRLEAQVASVLGIEGSTLSVDQKQAILRAHYIGIAEGHGIIDGDAGKSDFTQQELMSKIKELNSGNFTPAQRKTLMRDLQLAGAVAIKQSDFENYRQQISWYGSMSNELKAEYSNLSAAEAAQKAEQLARQKGELEAILKSDIRDGDFYVSRLLPTDHEGEIVAEWREAFHDAKIDMTANPYYQEFIKTAITHYQSQINFLNTQARGTDMYSAIDRGFGRVIKSNLNELNDIQMARQQQNLENLISQARLQMDQNPHMQTQYAQLLRRMEHRLKLLGGHQEVAKAREQLEIYKSTVKHFSEMDPNSSPTAIPALQRLTTKLMDFGLYVPKGLEADVDAVLTDASSQLNRFKRAKFPELYRTLDSRSEYIKQRISTSSTSAPDLARNLAHLLRVRKRLENDLQQDMPDFVRSEYESEIQFADDTYADAATMCLKRLSDRLEYLESKGLSSIEATKQELLMEELLSLYQGAQIVNNSLNNPSIDSMLQRSHVLFEQHNAAIATRAAALEQSSDITQDIRMQWSQYVTTQAGVIDQFDEIKLSERTYDLIETDIDSLDQLIEDLESNRANAPESIHKLLDEQIQRALSTRARYDSALWLSSKKQSDTGLLGSAKDWLDGFVDGASDAIDSAGDYLLSADYIPGVDSQDSMSQDLLLSADVVPDSQFIQNIENQARPIMSSDFSSMNLRQLMAVHKQLGELHGLLNVEPFEGDAQVEADQLLADMGRHLEALNERAEQLGLSLRRNSERLPRHEVYRHTDVVAIPDVHGDVGALHRSLMAQGIVNESGEWIGGNKVVELAGDYIDRAPESLQVMDYLMRLSKDAETFGGKVHLLIGNHEAFMLASLIGGEGRWKDGQIGRYTDHSGMWMKYGGEQIMTEFNQKYGTNFDQHSVNEFMDAMRQTSYYDFLKSLDVMSQVDDGLYLHAGLNLKWTRIMVGDANTISAYMPFLTQEQALYISSIPAGPDRINQMWKYAISLAENHNDFSLFNALAESGRSRSADGMTGPRHGGLLWMDFSEMQPLDMTLGPTGNPDGMTEQEYYEIATTLKSLGINTLVVGHTYAENIQFSHGFARYGISVVGLDVAQSKGYDHSWQRNNTEAGGVMDRNGNLTVVGTQGARITQYSDGTWR